MPRCSRVRRPECPIGDRDPTHRAARNGRGESDRPRRRGRLFSFAPTNEPQLNRPAQAGTDAQRLPTIALRHVARNAEAALDALEDRLSALERTALVWAGPHDISKSYAANDLCQRGGSLWLALIDVKAGDAPGSSPSWRRLAESRA